MEIIKTDFQDLVVIKPRIFEDARGYFYESYNKKLIFGGFEQKYLS